MATARKKPRFKQGSVGTPKTRRMQRHLAEHIHALTCEKTQTEGAGLTGLTVNDMRNFRAGNMPSLRLLISMVKTLRVTPESLLQKSDLVRLPGGKRSPGAKLPLICGRLRKIAKHSEPASLARKTGLPISTIYQLRSKKTTVGLHVFLGFVEAGHSPSELLLGGNGKLIR